MQSKIFFVFIQYVIFDNKYNFINAKAIIGTSKIKQVVENEFSSVACLVRKIPENSIERNVFCTATFISTTHLLTSEHCLNNAGEIGFVVNAGSHDIRLSHSYFPLWWLTFKTFINIYKLTAVHEHNDIGIIRLPESVLDITPTPLSKVSPINALVGEKLTIVGCGFANTGQIPVIKEKAPVKVISNTECTYKTSKHRRSVIPVPDNYICTYNKPYILLALGDFGGPLLYNGELVGINIGLNPLEGNLDDPKKKNLHLSINDYDHFIQYNLCI